MSDGYTTPLPTAAQPDWYTPFSPIGRRLPNRGGLHTPRANIAIEDAGYTAHLAHTSASDTVAYVAPGPRLLDCAADEARRSLMQRLEIAVGEPAAVSSPKRHEVALPAPATEAQALIHTQPAGSLVAKFAVA